MSRRTGWALLITANMLFWCMLSLYQTPAAAQRSTGGKPPFANAVEQRMQMIDHLAEIKDLLKEQNALLRSGNLQVVVGESQQR
jgi:hypothetical protein